MRNSRKLWSPEHIRPFGAEGILAELTEQCARKGRYFALTGEQPECFIHDDFKVFFGNQPVWPRVSWLPSGTQNRPSPQGAIEILLPSSLRTNNLFVVIQGSKGWEVESYVHAFDPQVAEGWYHADNMTTEEIQREAALQGERLAATEEARRNIQAEERVLGLAATDDATVRALIHMLAACQGVGE